VIFSPNGNRTNCVAGANPVFDNPTAAGWYNPAAFYNTVAPEFGNCARNNLRGPRQVNIDFSTSYDVNDHFTLTLEALNLTDEVQDQWVDSVGNRLSFYHHQGRQYYVGARFKY